MSTPKHYCMLSIYSIAATNPETPPATIMVVVDVVPPPWRLSRMPICPLGIGGGVGYVVEIAEPYG